MSKTSRYFVQPGVNFLDFSPAYPGDTSLEGQRIQLRGTSGVDRVYVGLGFSFDFTFSLGSTDLIFVAGARADFIASLSGSNLRLTSDDGSDTQITLGTGDRVVFTDGALSTTALIGALQSGNAEPALDASLTASGTVAEVADRTLVAGAASSRVLGFASGTEGHAFGQARPGMRLVLKGTPYADVVYVQSGTVVDFRNSLAGEDQIYLTGRWSDYTKIKIGSSLRLTRDAERVDVGQGDRLFFADGSVLVQHAMTAVSNNPSASTTDLGVQWDAARGTPVQSVTTGTLALANFTDSGALADDFLSNDSTFDLSLTGNPADTTVVYQMRVLGANTWTDLAGSAVAQLADGRYQFRAKVQNAQGIFAYSNVVPTRGAIVIDQTSPGALSLALDIDNGTSASDGLSSHGTVNVSGLEAGVIWQYSTNGGTLWADGSGSRFTLGQANALVSYAAQRVQVRQIDAAGNTGRVAQAPAYTIDQFAAPPSISLYSDSGLNPGDGISKIGTVIVSGLESGAVWQFSTDAGSTWITGGGNSFELGQGSYAANSLQVKQTDALGNVSLPGRNAGAIQIDQSPPQAPTLALAHDNGSSSNDGVSNDGTLLVLGLLEAGARWLFYPPGEVTRRSTGTSFSLSPGTYPLGSLQIEQQDAAGNYSSTWSYPRSITIDTTPPAAAVLALATDSGVSGSDGISNIGTVTVSGLEAGLTWQYSLSGTC